MITTYLTTKTTFINIKSQLQIIQIMIVHLIKQ